MNLYKTVLFGKQLNKEVLTIKNEYIVDAKKIFMTYGGNKYQMERDQKYEEYRSYNISKEKELTWIKEYQNRLLKDIQKINKNDELITLVINFIETIKTYKNVEILKIFIKRIKEKMNKQEVDSFTRMIIAEQLLELIKSIDNIEHNRILNVVKTFALNELKIINENSIIVSEEIRDLDYLKDEIKEKNILKRVRRKIEEWL
ncbi:MAG: hypothetical protein ACOC1K_07560 [Nanoarchaeota archaeon]